MEKILDFKDCIDMSSKKRHLIMGNGFSVSLFPDIFNYKKLSEKIKDSKIKALFSEFNTSDFEFVVLKLTESLRVLNYYDTDKKVYNLVKEDTEKLKEILINVITASHPAYPKLITEAQYYSCFQYLQHFKDGRKYSFNYDLLLYWVFMHFIDDKINKLSLDDGFRTDHDDNSMVTWEIGRELQQNLYYIHGAMHIFKDEIGVIQKYTWNNGDKTIGQQVKESIDENKFPVFISEGTQEHKLKRIKENGYLSRSFSSLKSISDDLFIFGHSIRNEDDHVFDIINANKKLKKIFISLHGGFDKVGNQKILEKVKNWRNDYKSKDREYIFYDSKTANVWDK